jgi:spermidine/putrescine transport system substrate-binding protein
MYSKNILISLLLAISLFISCTSKNNQASSSENEKKTVSLFIWSNYISNETVKEFENKYKMKVIISNYSSNEELLSKLQAGAIGYDVIVPSDYMVAIMKKLNLLVPLNKDLIKNINGIDPKFLGLEYDTKNEFTLPYGWSTTGIAINTKYLKENLKSWRDLFENKKIHGKVNLLDDNREVFAAALKVNGYSINSKKNIEVTRAKDYLIQNKKQIKSFNSEPIDMLLNGEVWVAQMYSTDALQAQNKSNGLIKYIIPEEGCTMSVDNLAIPLGAKNLEGANLLINFLLSQESNLAFVKKIYSGPILINTRDKLPEELRTNSSLFPDQTTRSKFEMLNDLGEFTSLYDQFWTELKAE